MRFIATALSVPGLGLALLAACPAAAQTTPAPADTARLRYTEEVLAAPAAVPVVRADRQQWKLGLNNFRLDSYPLGGNYSVGPYYTRYGLHLAYERRLGRAFSVQAEASPALVHVRGVGEADIQARLGLRAQLQGRYYYNQERRRRLGHRTAGFSANYFALAVGSGLRTGQVRETPFYLLGNVPRGAADLALLYGVQRRLGRYGFVDASVGATALVTSGGVDNVALNGSLRLGLALPDAGPAAPVPADEVAALLPRAYVGAQVGGYSYRVHFSTVNPFPVNTVTMHGNEVWTTRYDDSGVYRDGYGTYTTYMTTLPYVYCGYYLTPRLAVQLGVQYERETKHAGSISIDAPDRQFPVANVFAQHDTWAVPVQLRYALTPVLQQRFQLDGLAGITPMGVAVHLREYEVANRRATDQVVYEFRRTHFGVHGMLGLAAEYGFGRRRRVQAVAEGVVTKDLSYLLAGSSLLQGGVSLGLRYRFGYR